MVYLRVWSTMGRGLPWVHEESSEKVGPREVVESVLFGGDGSRNYLSVEMVC